MARLERRAVVIGASMAGLLAARTLSDHYDRVTLVDRDEMPALPVNRGGVPQGRHVHGLLSSGLAVVERMFPGTTDDLVARGAQLGDAQQDARYYFGPAPLAAGRAGLPALGVSRPLLEWYVRRRLLSTPVTVQEHTSVLDLAFTADERRVDGVIVTDRDSGTPHLLPAHLVVDASGRTSRTPEWLERRGYLAPHEDVRRIDKRYATRTFRHPRGADEPVVTAVPASPVLPRGGLAIANEDDVLMTCLVGRDGERPPMELEAYRAWARTLASPVLADLLDGLVPLDEGLAYRFPANRRRQYEQLTRFPRGLVVTGDALCAFDPVYGQGMSVAALEAELLGRCLAEGVTGLARRFHEGAAAIIDTPWAIAAGPPTDRRPSLRERLASGYLRRLVGAAAHDRELATAFLRVNHLVDTPADLQRPRVALRVLRSIVRSPAAGGRDSDRSRSHEPVGSRSA
jgi:2-polyprenyl-6-methoxyphenol hydroxylase-like FAD-dependent oxidoreductase